MTPSLTMSVHVWTRVVHSQPRKDCHDRICTGKFVQMYKQGQLCRGTPPAKCTQAPDLGQLYSMCGRTLQLRGVYCKCVVLEPTTRDGWSSRDEEIGEEC